MFAKLRPGHRRSGSTPTSPSPNQIPSGFLPIPPSSSHGPTSPSSIEDFLHGFKSPPPPPPPPPSGSQQQQGSSGPSSSSAAAAGSLAATTTAATITTTGESPISPMPPNLPPIPRIASVYGKEEVLERTQGLGIGMGMSIGSSSSSGGGNGSGSGVGSGIGSGIGIGISVHHPELQRAKTTESFDTQSSGSPILGDQAVFSPPPGRYEQLQAQDRLRDMRSPSGSSDQYRSPSSMSQLTSPHVRREAGISESEFRSILQGKHLPPIPGNASHPARSPHDVLTSPPAQLSIDESHAAHTHHSFSSRQSAMNLVGNQSRQSLAASMTTTTTSRSGDRATKTKTRLLNPMSLLLRRRNGQTLDHLAEESLVSHRNQNLISPGLPDNFDPSIRGNVVHDFSAPRQRRNFSNHNMAELAEKERREAVAASSSLSSSSREGHYVKTRAMSEDLRHDRQHTPVFKEHFEDDADADADKKKRADSALRAENLANTDFISRNSLLLSEENAAPLPPFARAGQKTIYKPPHEQPPSQSPPPPPVPAKDGEDEPPSLLRSQQQPTPLSPLMEDPVSPTTVPDLDPDPDPTPKRQSNTSTLRQQSTTTSHRSPASARSSRISRMNSAASQNGLPPHMFSRASRFSFQYSSTDSAAQERLLEERHREKAAKAKAERGSVGYDDEDEFDYDGLDLDAMDDDVPMNGEDWDYGGGGGGGLGIGNMTLEDMQMGGGGGGGGLGGMTLDDFGSGGGRGGGLGGMSMDDFEGGGLGNMSLDDFEGGSGGLGGMTLDDMPGTGAGGLGNMTLDDLSSKAAAPAIPDYSPLRENPLDTTEATAGASMDGFGLGINAAGKATATTTSMPHSHTSSTSIKRKPVGEEPPPPEQDDFYFEDGEFADEDFLREINGTAEEEDAFDESVFDDPNHPLYERRQPTQAPPIPRMSSKRTHNTLKGRKPRSRPPSDPLPEHPDPGAPIHQVEAYQTALAMFANKAAAAGRFDRANSVDSSASSLAYQGGPVQEKPPTIAAAPELTPDVARFSRDSSTISPATARASGGNELDSLSKSVGFMLPGAGAYEDSYASDFDYSDYDSTFEDDPMIAAANAEALENDDEGLYGSEFGFYARPGASADNPDDPTSALYGGYFGPKNWGEIKRQRSTREPNLTPITERSEYSTRNSFIGLGFAEHERVGAGGQPSPALAQLARMSQSPGWEGDMNIETLLKLRNRAWGGSQGSNIDKSSPRQGSSSPMGMSPVMPKGEGADKRQQFWTSSPMSRSVFSPGEVGIPEDPDPDADDEFDEEMLREANYDDEDEAEGEEYEEEDGEQDDEEGIEEQDHSWQEQDEGVSPLEEESPPSESPTIRASAAGLQSTIDPAISPINIGAPFSFPTSQSHSQPQSHHHTSPHSLSVATTATTTTSSSSTVLVSPISPAGVQHFKTAHSRTGSDSVSYLRERDEEKGEFRWVLERRRTAEDGAEVVERTAVEGGRI